MLSSCLLTKKFQWEVFPSLAQSVSLGNILSTSTLILQSVLFQRCYPCSNTQTTRLSFRSIPSVQQCYWVSLMNKDKIMGSHVWDNQTTLAEYQRTSRFLHAKAFLHLSLLGRWRSHAPLTQQNFKDDNSTVFLLDETRWCRGQVLCSPQFRENGALKQKAEKPPWTRWSPVVKCFNMSSKKASSHGQRQPTNTPKASEHPRFFLHQLAHLTG